MAAIDGVVSRLTCQGLLRTVARPRTRSRLLVRTTRWISSKEQERPAHRSSLRLEDVRKRDQPLLKNFGKPFRVIDQRSFVACNEPVKIVDSEIECVCSWNEASGSRQAIYVPGDASRPRRTSISLSDPATRASLAPARRNRPWGFCNPGRGPRTVFWDDPLAALCVTDPELKLDHVDVMIHDEMMLHLLLIAQNGAAPFFGRPFLKPLKSVMFNMQLIGNTLVLKGYSEPVFSDKWRVPWDMSGDWEFYKVTTESVPAVEESSIHHQLLRYNIGPLSCLVRVTVHGTMQKMPSPTGPPEAAQARNLHGIHVIKAGQGVHPVSSFTAIPRKSPGTVKTDARRLRSLTARVWLSGQTRLGIANIVPVDQIEDLGGLTVVDMADLVRHYENMNQEGLRRLAGLLATLRDVVRARGAPCVGIFFPPSTSARSTIDERNYAIHVYGAGTDEAPVLLDWHKEHFWSQSKRHEKKDWTLRKVPTGITLRKVPPGITLRKVPPGIKLKRPQSNTTKEQAPPLGEINEKHGDAPKGFIRKWVQRLGF